MQKNIATLQNLALSENLATPCPSENPALLRKDEIRSNTSPKIPQNLSLRTAFQTLWKALDMSSATAQVALNLLDSLESVATL